MERAVLEIATLNVVDGKGTEFESVFELAIPLISSIAGYLKHELNRCIENPNQYVLLVWWESLEAHTIGFRQSEEYQQWKELLHHFYEPDFTVFHYLKN